MNNRAIVISVAVGALVLIWAVFFMPSSDEEDREAAPAATGEAEPNLPVAAPAPVVAPEATAVPEQAAAPTRTAPSPQAAAAAQQPHIQQRPQKMGPFEELKASFEREGRDPEAGATEERIRTLLKQPDIPEGMLRQISCVKTTCKLELRWTASDLQPYMVLMMSLVSNISQKLAASPIGEDEGQQTHAIEVYVSRVEPPLTPAPAN